MIEIVEKKNPQRMAIWIFCRQAVVIIFSTPAALSILSTLNYHWDMGPAIRRILQSYHRFIEVIWTYLLRFFGIELNIRPEVAVFFFFLSSPVVVTFILLLIRQEIEVCRRFRLNKISAPRDSYSIGTKRDVDGSIFRKWNTNYILRAIIRRQIVSERKEIANIENNVNKYWNMASLLSVLLIFLFFELWIYFAFLIAVWLSLALKLLLYFSFYSPIVWVAWFVSPDPFSEWDFKFAVVVPISAAVLYIFFYCAFPDWWNLFPEDISGGTFISPLIALFLVITLISFYIVSTVLPIRTPAYALLWVLGIIVFTWLADNILPWPDLQNRLLNWLDRNNI